MSIAGKIRKLYMKHFLKKRLENFENPGFINVKAGAGDSVNYVRDIYIPEPLMVELENRLYSEHGEDGGKALYRAAKRAYFEFGYIADLPSKRDSDDSDVKKAFDFVAQYASIAYSDELDYNLDPGMECYKLQTDNYVVCNKTGKDFFVGGINAGVIGYILNDKQIEASSLSCQGRGDKKCSVKCGRPEELEKEPVNVFSDFEVETVREEYQKMNKVREVDSKSLQDMIDDKTFKHGDSLRYRGNRYFPIEVTLPHMISQELEWEGYEDILFDAAYDYGREIGEGEELGFVREHLTATGWGDVQVNENGKEIEVTYFPYTAHVSEIDYTLFRGLASGIVSGVKDQEIRFNEFESWEDGDTLSLKISS